MKPLLTVFAAADYLGLTVEYSSDLPAGCAGCLAPARDFILINANLSPVEQRFTIAHEIGHYVLHDRQRSWSGNLWFFRRQWNLHSVRSATRWTRRWMHRVFTMEHEADMYAMCMLICVGDKDALGDYLSKHPKKIGWCILLTLVRIGQRMRRALYRICALGWVEHG